jgi:hypothetical protein
MKANNKILSVFIVLAAAASSAYVAAADKTNEGASSTPKNEVRTVSKEGVTVHSVKGADKIDRARQEKRAQEAKAKK